MASPQIENGYTKIANDIMDALCKTRIPGQARQVFDFIVRKIYGWNKTEDQISLTQFVEGTGLKKYDIIPARTMLIRMNMITVAQKGNDETLTYTVQKDYDKWSPLPKRATLPKKATVVAQKGNKSLPKTPPTKDTNTKDTIQKTLGVDKPLQPHQRFIEDFGKLYTSMSGQPFKADTKHFIIIANLIKKYGVDAISDKARILALYCQRADVWFVKDGVADFTIEKLSSQWNSIIPQSRMSDQEIKDQKTVENLRKMRERDERINSEIFSNAGN